MPAVLARRGLAAIAALGAALSGCGEDPERPRSEKPARTPNPTIAQQSPAPSPARGSSANAFIGSLAVDPASGTLFLGTGLGLHRYDPRRGDDAPRVTGRLRTPEGSGTVSSNLVVRFAGPGELLASGHPERGSLPENVGLIRSTDDGRTWKPISLLGDADFHVLQVAGDRIAAVRAEETDIEISSDGGRTFETRTPPEPPVDVAFDPRDSSRLVMTTEEAGLFSSSDEGRSWRPRDPAALSSQLAWAAPDALYRADAGGAVKVSADGGRTWRDRGTVAKTANELAADADGDLYASLPGAEVKRSRDGGATWRTFVRLR